jgi:ferredoxin
MKSQNQQKGRMNVQMVRRIIQINEDKCNGCGACASACHEGAIGMVDGKAKLLRDDYCDGLGDCLPTCPTGAIKFVEREAAAYDEEAVKENMKKRAAQGKNGKAAVSETAVGAVASEHVAPQAGAVSQPTGGCPGSRMRMLREQAEKEDVLAGEINFVKAPASQLAQWPCQIKLVPTNAPYFNGAKLLIAADCTAYAYANMHQEFMRGKVTIIGCPKLDDIDYSEKLTTIIRDNDIKEVTIVRMEVPCCGGLEMAAKKAIQESGKFIPWQVVTISIDGKKLD